MTQGLLDLKRRYWNLRRFRTGRRKDQTPYGLLGLKLPELSFWELLKVTSEEFREKLSAMEATPWDSASSEDRVDDLAVDVRKAEVAALEAIGQLGVLDPQ